MNRQRVGAARIRIGVRLCGAIVLGWTVVAALSDSWRVAEAIVVRWALQFGGFGDVDRVGHELLATSDDGQRFSAVISPWCSTLALVVGFAVAAAVVPFGRRWRAFVCASAIVIAGNIARIVATVGIGMGEGPGAIETFHDGPATWFAVLCVLAAVGAFGAALTRGARRYSAAAEVSTDGSHDPGPLVTAPGSLRS